MGEALGLKGVMARWEPQPCVPLSQSPVHRNLGFWPFGQMSYPVPEPDDPCLGSGRRKEGPLASLYSQDQAMPWWVVSQVVKVCGLSWSPW